MADIYDGKIGHTYQTTEDAIKALVQLSNKIEAHKFNMTLEKSSGSTRQSIDGLVKEFDTAKNCMGEIVRKTREVLCYTNDGFKAADVKAAEELKKSGNHPG